MNRIKSKSAERRRFVRLPLIFWANYRLHLPYLGIQKAFNRGIIRNISAGGICLEGKDKYEAGSVIEIEIFGTAVDPHVLVIGHIVWTHINRESGNCMYGLEFIETEEYGSDKIRNIVETFTSTD